MNSHYEATLRTIASFGSAVRHPGGYWTNPAVPHPRPDLVIPPPWSASTEVIRQLVWLGKLIVTKRTSTGLPTEVKFNG